MRENHADVSGKNNSGYKNGQTLIKHFCIDCLKKGIKTEITYNAKRCMSHAISFLMLKQWKNKEFKEKTLKASFEGRKIKPNKPEKLLNKLLQQLFHNKYRYNKMTIIAGLIPDFVNDSEKKIIELYGDYWHNRPEVKKRDKNRAGIYNLFGNYKTLIIWEHELRDLDKLKQKILKF